CCSRQVQNFDLDQKVLVSGPLWRHWLQRTNLWRRWTSPRPWASDKELFGPTVSPQLVQSGKGRIASDPALLNLPRPLMVGAFFRLGSNEATYGLRQGGAGFHRNRPAAGKAKRTLSAGIVRRVRNADGR